MMKIMDMKSYQRFQAGELMEGSRKCLLDSSNVNSPNQPKDLLTKACKIQNPTNISYGMA